MRAILLARCPLCTAPPVAALPGVLKGDGGLLLIQVHVRRLPDHLAAAGDPRGALLRMGDRQN